MLVDEGEAESDATVIGPVAALCAAGEAVEDDVSLFDRDTVAAVLDGDADSVLDTFDGDRGRTTGVPVGVVEQIGDDPTEPALVHSYDDLADLGFEANGNAAAAEYPNRLDDHLGSAHILEVVPLASE